MSHWLWPLPCILHFPMVCNLILPFKLRLSAWWFIELRNRLHEYNCTNESFLSWMFFYFWWGEYLQKIIKLEIGGKNHNTRMKWIQQIKTVRSGSASNETSAHEANNQSQISYLMPFWVSTVGLLWRYGHLSWNISNILNGKKSISFLLCSSRICTSKYLEMIFRWKSEFLPDSIECRS